MSEHRSAAYLLLKVAVPALLAGFIGGAQLEIFRHSDQPHYNTRQPVELTAADRRAYPLHAKLPPMDVLLHIEDQKTFAAASLVQMSSAERKQGYRLLGWTAEPMANHICEVHIPAGFDVIADPRGSGIAEFTDRLNSETITHELLHCARGAWHAK